MVSNLQNGNHGNTGATTTFSKNQKAQVSAMVEEIVGCKWSMRLLILIGNGQSRPSALLRACPGLSAKVMNERLKKMLAFGIIQRYVYGEKPPVQVEYKLSSFGKQFIKIISAIQKLQKEIDDGKITPSRNK